MNFLITACCHVPPFLLAEIYCVFVSAPIHIFAFTANCLPSLYHFQCGPLVHELSLENFFASHDSTNIFRAVCDEMCVNCCQAQSCSFLKQGFLSLVSNFMANCYIYSWKGYRFCSDILLVLSSPFADYVSVLVGSIMINTRSSHEFRHSIGTQVGISYSEISDHIQVATSHHEER